MTKHFGMSVAGVVLGLVAAVSAQDYQVISVHDGGTITGTVKWSGPMPHLTPMTINKDVLICDPNSQKTRDLERLIVGPQAGVANTVVFLKEVSRGKAMDLPQQRRFLDQRHCRYEPHIMLVPSDATLQMKSSDATLHTIHMDGAATYNALSFYKPDHNPRDADRRPGQFKVQWWPYLDECGNVCGAASVLCGH